MASSSFVGRSAHSLARTRHVLKDPLGKTSVSASLNAKKVAGSYAKQLYDSLASKPMKVDAELKELRSRLAQKDISPAERQAILKSIEKGEKKFDELDKTTKKMAADSGAQLVLLSELQYQLAILTQIAGDSEQLKPIKDVVNGVAKDIEQLIAWLKKTDFTAVDFMSMKQDLDEMEKKLEALPSDMNDYIKRRLKEQYKKENEDADKKKLEADLKKQIEDKKDKDDKKKTQKTLDNINKNTDPKTSKTNEQKLTAKEKKAAKEREDFYEGLDDKMEEVEEFLQKHQETMKSIKSYIGNSLLRIGDKIGIGALNLGNVGRVGAWATKLAFSNPVDRIKNNSLVKKSQALAQYGRDYQRAKQISGGNLTPLRQEFKADRKEEEAGAAGHGISVHQYWRKKQEVLNHLKRNNIKYDKKDNLTDLINKARGVKTKTDKNASLNAREDEWGHPSLRQSAKDIAQQIKVPQPHTTEEYHPRRTAANDSLAGHIPVAVATPLNAAPSPISFGDESNSGDDSNKAIVDELKEQTASSKRMEKEVGAVGKNLGKDQSSFLSGLTDGIKGIGSTISSFFGEGGLIKTITSVVGGVGSLIGAALSSIAPVLAVAGAAFVGWKIGKAIYDKFLGDSPTFQSITDHVLDWVTGQNAKGEGILDTPAQTALKQKQQVEATQYDAMGNSTGMGTPDTSGPPPADTVGKAVLAAPKTVSNLLSGGSSIGGSGSESSSAAATATSGQSGVGASTVSGFGSKADPNAGSLGAIGGKISDFVGSVFNKGGNAKTDQVDPEVQSRFIAMGKEYKERTGKNLTITSAFRTPEEQEALRKSGKGHKTAQPGNSWHQYGQALDVDHNQVNQLKQMGLLQKYGFTQPFPGDDPVHIQSAALAINPAAAGIKLTTSSANANSASTAPASSAKEGFRLPEPQIQTAQADTSAPSVNKTNGGTVGADSKVSINTIPTFDMSDSHLVAMNVGMFV